MRKLGTLEPVIFFKNYRDPAHPPGYLVLSPYSDFPTPPGYAREYADNLPDIDKLQKTLIEQERIAQESDIIYNEVIMGAKRKEIYDRLRSRMVSSSTTPYERDFIEAYLMLQDEKRDRHRQRFLERVMFLHAREMDTPRDRGVDSETVKLDRVNF